MLSHCVIPFGFRKEKTESLRYQFLAIFAFDQFTQYKGQKKNPMHFNCGPLLKAESRLPSLAKVLSCLVRVGVPRVPWAVRYSDKL